MKQYNSSIRGKLYQYFLGKLGLKKSTKGYWRCNCIYCGGYHTFGINLEGYKAHCFKCLKKTNPLQLLMDMQDFQNRNEAFKYLDIQQEYTAYERLHAKEEVVEKKELALPDSFSILSLGSSLMARAARHYIKKRGFNVEELSLSGVGYCTDGEYAGYIIFPYYRKGVLVYFQGRRYMGYGPKMKNPSEEVYGVGKESIIYNEDALFIYNKINVVESITNCRTLNDNTIALSGKSISSSQLSKIIMAPCQYIALILDDDALDKAYSLAMQIVHYKKVKVVVMPVKKDVNDLGKKKTLALIKKTPYGKYMDFLKAKNTINGQEPIHKTERPPNMPTSRGY